MFEELYSDALRKESEIISLSLERRLAEASMMKNVIRRVLEVAKNATVYRSYVFGCHLAEDTIVLLPFLAFSVKKEPAPENISAHTNLVMMIMDEYLKDSYGIYFGKTCDGYCYREIAEVVRRHDLPENDLGDIPDNGSAEHDNKAQAEKRYFEWYSQLRNNASDEEYFESRVQRLLGEMEEKSSMTGRALYLSDKVAATMMALCYDARRRPPYLTCRDKISKRDFAEMKIVQRGRKVPKRRKFPISELWSVDYMVSRKLWQYDDCDFFTPLLIAARIAVYGKWYDWRK